MYYFSGIINLKPYKMKPAEYIEDLIKRVGETEAFKSVERAIDHHKIIFKHHQSPKSLTTISFFENCLKLKNELAQ